MEPKGLDQASTRPSAGVGGEGHGGASATVRLSQGTAWWGRGACRLQP